MNQASPRPFAQAFLLLFLPLILAPNIAFAKSPELGSNVAEASAEDAEQLPRVMEPRDLVELPLLDSPALSPDGTKLLFLNRETQWKENRQVSRIQILDLEKAKFLPTPAPERSRESFSSAKWSPDGRGVLTELKRKKDEEKQAYYYDVGRAKFLRLTNQPTSVTDTQWSADGKAVYFRTSRWLDEKPFKDGEKIEPYEEGPPMELWRYDLEANKSDRMVWGEFSIRHYDISADGSLALISRSPDAVLANSFQSEVWLYNLNSNEASQLTRNGFYEKDARLSPDATQFAYIAVVNDKGEPYYEDNLFVQKIGEDKPRLLLPDMAMEVLDFAWDKDGSGLFILGNVGLSSQVFHVDLANGALSQLSHGDHEVSDWSYYRNTDTHVAIFKTAQSPGDVWIRHGADEFRQATHYFSKLMQKFRLPEQAGWQWKGRDGQNLEGLLVLPVGYVEGQKFPLVTIVHGGPRSSSKYGSWNVSRYVPVLAGKGYGVFLPNHRGGTGYGDAFMRDMVNGYFNNADKDVMDGIDTLIKAGYADKDKLAIMGWSAGGHMTNWLITQTDRFRVASSGAGASEWVSMYAESDVRHNRTPVFGAPPWEKNAPLDVYMAHSPLFQAWKVKTPTLFFAGKNDVRVPPSQSIMMHNALRSYGIPTHLYLAPGEPHNYRKPLNKLFKIETELDWYAHYMGNGAAASRAEDAVPAANDDAERQAEAAG